MSGLATTIRPPSSRLGGVAWLVFMVGMWIAFFVAMLEDGRRVGLGSTRAPYLGPGGV